MYPLRILDVYIPEQISKTSSLRHTDFKDCAHRLTLYKLRVCIRMQAHVNIYEINAQKCDKNM